MVVHAKKVGPLAHSMGRPVIPYASNSKLETFQLKVQEREASMNHGSAQGK